MRVFTFELSLHIRLQVADSFLCLHYLLLVITLIKLSAESDLILTKLGMSRI